MRFQIPHRYMLTEATKGYIGSGMGQACHWFLGRRLWGLQDSFLFVGHIQSPIRLESFEWWWWDSKRCVWGVAGQQLCQKNDVIQAWVACGVGSTTSFVRSALHL